MALNIPMPGLPGDALLKGINTGSQMFSRIMQPIIQREQLAEQGKYHQGSLAEQGKYHGGLLKHYEDRLKQEAIHQAQQMALAKQKEARLWAMAPLQRQVELLRMRALQEKLDPNHEVNQIKRLYELANNPEYANQSLAGNQNIQPNNELLRDKLSAMGMFGQNNESMTGKGQFPMQEQMEAPEYPIPETTSKVNESSKPNLMQMIVGGALKKRTGVNPFAINKESALTGAARDAESMKLLAEREGKNSETYKMAEAIQRDKKQMHEDLSAIRQRQANGLKPGDTEIKDQQTGQVIGFRKQTTDKQKEAAKNTILFNQLYPLVQGSAKLSGPGATARFEEAARTYHTNPNSKKIIDDLLIADKAASTTAVTEASRFNAGHTNQTFNRLVDTLKSEDIPKKLKKWIKEYGIPAEANIKADKRWQEELNKAEKLANSRIPATMDYYFDPDKQFAHQQEQQNAENPSNEKIKVWDNIDNKWVEITQEEFDKDRS